MTTKQWFQGVIKLIIVIIIIWFLLELSLSVRKRILKASKQPITMTMTITRTITTDVRAYCPKECCVPNPECLDGRFANNEIAQGRAIASNSLLRGTVLRVPGYGVAIVKDHGPNLIEVFFEKHEDAVNWGVKRDVQVEVLR